MIDLFSILTTGGMVLFGYSPFKQDSTSGLLLNKFIQTVLIDGNVTGDSLIIGSQEVRWLIAHEAGLVFVAVHPKIIPLAYVPSLLEQVKERFLQIHGAERKSYFKTISNFNDDFEVMLAKIEARTASAAEKKPRGSKTFEKPTKAGGKQLREWTGTDKVSKKHLSQLDYSKKTDQDDATEPTGSLNRPDSDPLCTAGLSSGGELLELSADPSKSSHRSPASRSKFWAFLQSATGQKELAKEDVATAVAHMREHLMSKNVAAAVADHICREVEGTLIGSKTGTLTTIAASVKKATEAAVQKILLPKTESDLLQEIHRLRSSSSRPYVMAFVGVNGVGKSTNLAKVCFWLLQNRLRLLVVAGDTFRSGAVEQLRTHVNNLSISRPSRSIELFERGYGKDAAAIAKEAIVYARREGFEVVMIDTAGRMQDNTPLMQALAKLVQINRPDKTIFVGEALVGNEAVDQLSKFNRALADCCSADSSTEGSGKIDGILLTKFDTVDDKVGAALNMTFIAAAPILFVGVGQTYTDLRRLNVRLVADSLLS